MLDKSKQKNILLSIFLITVFILLVIIPFDVPLVIWLPILLVHVLLSSVLMMVMDTFVGEYASKVPHKVFIMTSSSFSCRDLYGTMINEWVVKGYLYQPVTMGKTVWSL
jgi:hypothetical protein